MSYDLVTFDIKILFSCALIKKIVSSGVITDN